MEIEGFENYMIFEDSTVVNLITGKVMKPQSDGNGYNRVRLSKNGEQTHKSVHRLLGQAYIDNPENKPFIDHIDGNTHNNDLSNLRWATQSENNQNTKIPITNTSGTKNIHWNNHNNCWKYGKTINGIKHQKLDKDLETLKEYKKNYEENQNNEFITTRP